MDGPLRVDASAITALASDFPVFSMPSRDDRARWECACADGWCWEASPDIKQGIHMIRYDTSTALPPPGPGRRPSACTRAPACCSGCGTDGGNGGFNAGLAAETQVDAVVGIGLDDDHNAGTNAAIDCHPADDGVRGVSVDVGPRPQPSRPWCPADASEIQVDHTTASVVASHPVHRSLPTRTRSSRSRRIAVVCGSECRTPRRPSTDCSGGTPETTMAARSMPDNPCLRGRQRCPARAKPDSRPRRAR